MTERFDLDPTGNWTGYVQKTCGATVLDQYREHNNVNEIDNDNPFSESQFKTLEYRPEFPDRFASFDHALEFCGRFFHWQNFEHYHWGLGLLTPATVDYRLGDQVLETRRRGLQAACAAHPERFVRQVPRPLPLPKTVWINPPADLPEPRLLPLLRDTDFQRQVSQTG